MCARICLATRTVVLEVLSTASNDSEDSFDWLQPSAQSFGGDPDVIIITGTSVAGRLTVSLVQTLFREGHPVRGSVKGFVPMLGCVAQERAYEP